MKKHLLPLILIFALMLSFTACAVRKSIDNRIPETVGKDYAEKPSPVVPDDTGSVPETGNETEKVTERVTEKITDKVTEPVTEPPAPETVPPTDDWTKYDNEVQGWWSGGVWAGDEDLPYKRPSWPRYSQNQIGKYWADCIFSESLDPVITLTFDCGYYNGNTGKILDQLKERGVHATFMLTMDYLKTAPEMVQRMIDEGHTLGNHTVHHKVMPSLSISEQTSEIMEVHNYVKDHFGYEMHVMRFPEGKYSERSLALMQSLGYRSAFWSFAYGDYNTDAQPALDSSLQLLIDSIHPGALYLLHDCSTTNTAIIGDFIDQARALGYSFSDGYPK